jgi:hypothetical protein
VTRSFQPHFHLVALISEMEKRKVVIVLNKTKSHENVEEMEVELHHSSFQHRNEMSG